MGEVYAAVLVMANTFWTSRSDQQCVVSDGHTAEELCSKGDGLTYKWVKQSFSNCFETVLFKILCLSREWIFKGEVIDSSSKDYAWWKQTTTFEWHKRRTDWNVQPDLDHGEQPSCWRNPISKLVLLLKGTTGLVSAACMTEQLIVFLLSSNTKTELLTKH